MANRLQPLNLVDFTGGINLRRNQFQLADNESPDLLNVDIDPRGGFFTRRGWRRWNAADVIDPTVNAWAPRNAFLHTWSGGQQHVYVVNDNDIYWADDLGVFTALAGVAAGASPHGADFAAWGDLLYFVTGRLGPSYRRTGVAAPVALAPATFSEIEAPVANTMPQAEFIEAHAGYMFIANTNEGGIDHRARIRWSHPNQPDAFRAGDFIDIETNGAEITGLLSFRDHLLIFKSSSLWALYGYEDESFQLVKVSDRAGAPTTTAISRSETGVYYYSTSDRGGIYAYTGEQPVYLSERLSTVFEGVFSQPNVFVSWAGRRLWVSVPWTKDAGSTAEPASTFVFDPTIGDAGAWVMYNSAYGTIGTVLDGANVNVKFPLAAIWSEVAAGMVTLDYEDNAFDAIALADTLATGGGDDIVTGLDEDIEVLDGFAGTPFDSYYRTRWLHAGWPDRKKSWRRPSFICRRVSEDVDLLVETYRNYDETTVNRSRIISITAAGGAMWTELGAAGPEEDGGFDWSELGAADPDGTGADWGSARAGSHVVRSGSMGLARSVQLLVKSTPTSARRAWGVDGIVAKFVMRRFR